MSDLNEVAEMGSHHEALMRMSKNCHWVAEVCVRNLMEWDVV